MCVVCVCIDTPYLWCMCVCYCNVNDILDVCMLRKDHRDCFQNNEPMFTKLIVPYRTNLSYFICV